MNLQFLLIPLSLHLICAMPLTDSENQDSRGIFDGVVPGATTTTTKAPANGLPVNGLPSASGALSQIGGSGPMLILGGFQAIVTKFDPSLVQGLPGLAGLPQLPAAGK
jgi:hypothetical protein